MSRPGVTITGGKGAREHIEARPDAVDDDAGFGIDDGRDRIGADVVSFPSALDRDAGRVRVCPCDNPRLQRWQLSCGPIDSSLGVQEIVNAWSNGPVTPLPPERAGASPLLNPTHDHIDLPSAAFGADQLLAPIERWRVGAVPSSHLGGIGLHLMAATLAPHD